MSLLNSTKSDSCSGINRIAQHLLNALQHKHALKNKAFNARFVESARTDIPGTANSEQSVSASRRFDFSIHIVTLHVPEPRGGKRVA